MIRKNNKKLYESIIRDISKIVKFNLNKRNYNILESKEDGKYLDLPARMNKPVSWSGPISKEAKQKWKEYQNSIIKINSENLEILVDKLKNAMLSKKGHNNFILNAHNSKFTSFYNKPDEDEDFFEQIERAVKEARIALETEDIDTSKILSTRQNKVNSWDKDKTLFWWDSSGFTLSIYKALSIIAQAYNIDIPKFDEEYNIFKTISVDTRFDNWYNGTHSSRPTDKQRDRAWEKARTGYEKDSKKLIKAREKFKKTDLYNDIIEILDIVEDDLITVESNYKNWKQEFNEINKKNEYARKLKNAIEEVTPLVNDVLKKEFYSERSLSWGVETLYKLAGTAYIESNNEFPEIKVLSSRTGSWLSGMHRTVEFEIIGADGNSYGTVTLQDKGLNDDDGNPVPGFGPWD